MSAFQEAFQNKFPVRTKGQRRDKHVPIPYDRVRVIGEFKAAAGYDINASVMEALEFEHEGRLYPAWRRKASKPTETYAIQQHTALKSIAL